MPLSKTRQKQGVEVLFDVAEDGVMMTLRNERHQSRWVTFQIVHPKLDTITGVYRVEGTSTRHQEHRWDSTVQPGDVATLIKQVTSSKPSHDTGQTDDTKPWPDWMAEV